MFSGTLLITFTGSTKNYKKGVTQFLNSIEILLYLNIICNVFFGGDSKLKQVTLRDLIKFFTLRNLNKLGATMT